MNYRCTVPGSEHSVEYVASELLVRSRDIEIVILYRYRGKLYRVTEITWQRDYVKAGEAK